MEFRRLFTREEAESALPLVRRIVADILATAASLRGLPDDHEDVPGLKVQLVEHVEELQQVGCYYKDWNFTLGLVDFPALIDGETVYLCWRSDEEHVGWYHALDAGYGGRRPLEGTPAAG